MKTLEDRVSKGASKIGQIVERPPGDLNPWPGNPRTHSDKQLDKLKASIQTFGFTVPVLVDEAGVILSGHGRVQAAKELGLEKIPTRVLAGLSKTKKRAYVIADNKLAQLSGWDQALLKAELEILIRDEFEIEATGFTTAEIDLMFDAEDSRGKRSGRPSGGGCPPGSRHPHRGTSGSSATTACSAAMPWAPTAIRRSCLRSGRSWS